MIHGRKGHVVGALSCTRTHLAPPDKKGDKKTTHSPLGTTGEAASRGRATAVVDSRQTSVVNNRTKRQKPVFSALRHSLAAGEMSILEKLAI
jgi:hypothetical protein